MTPFFPRKLRLVLVAVTSSLVGLPALNAQSQQSSPGQPAMTGLQRAAEASLPAMAAPGTGATGAFNARALDAPTMSISLPDGRVLEAVRQQTTEDPANAKRSWVGTFPDEPGSMVAYSTVRGVTTGFISYGAETWEMLPSRGGKHVLYRVDERKLPTAELEVLPTLHVDHDDTVTASDYGLGMTTAATGGSVIDLLVVYTPKARAAYGQATLESMIENAVAMANQAYLNSKVAVTLRMVGLQEISYVESGLRSSYDNLRGTNDGKMDSVHTLRNNVGADVVSLISEDTGGCGIAGVMTKVSTAYAPEAFSVVKTSCLSQHSLAHEIGHNMGNRHDRDSTKDTGAYPYSYGFRRCTTDGSGFRTVMAYSCSGGKRVAWFSNPNVYYNGQATGISYESNPSKSADNARSMNNAAATVASFRAAKSTTSPSVTVPAAPSALSAVAASASVIDLRWTDNSGNESGFVVERSSNGVDFSQIASLGAGTTSHSSNGLAAATIYYYRVRAYNSAGNSAFSNTASTKTSTASLAPAKPGNVAAIDRTDGSARVTWSDLSSNESGFQVRRYKWDAATSSWGSRKVMSVAANATQLIDYSGRGKFRYSVRAVNSAGKSSYVGPVTVTVTKK
jgi:peptidyl-Asp metalloendopeptidase